MMKIHTRRGFLAISAGAALSACSSLPRGAAQRREILAGSDAEVPEFSVHEVSRETLSRLRAWPETGTPGHNGWPQGQSGGAPVIAPGDRLDLRIWDSETSSLITAPGQVATDMSDLTVSSNGSIFLPYIGELRVAGMPPDAARRMIQSQMESIVPSAQVQLAFSSGRQNSVDLIGGVSTPGSYPLEDGNITVLNLISLGGGVPESLRNPRVRLVRRGQVYITSLARIYDEPARDIPLRGGDRLVVEQDARFFIALGASGREEVVDFNTDRITALRAVSMMGGVTDSRADPRGILVLRNYPASALSRADGPSTERVVFSIDLTTADGLFSANEFQINSGDVVLATESPITSVQTIFGLLGNAFGLANRVPGT